MQYIVVDLLLNSVDKVIEFSNIASDFDTLKMDLKQNHKYIDAHSIVGIMALNLSKPITLFINEDRTTQVENFLQQIQPFTNS